MKQRKAEQDTIQLKQKKGTWLRFVKLFPKCRLPWVLLAVYLVVEVGLINLGVDETEYTAQLFAGDTSARLVTTLVIYLVINMLGSSLLVFMRNVTSARLARNMRLVLLNKVFRLPMGYFQQEDPREAVNRIVNRAVVVESTIMYVLVPNFTAAYTAFAVFKRVFSHDWRLSAVLLAFIPLKLLIAFLFGRINYSLSERDDKVQSGLIHRLAEMVTNIPLAKTFAKEDREAKKGEAYTARLYSLNIRSSWLSQFKDISETVVMLAESAVMVAVGLLLLGSKVITKRGWISFFLFSGTFSGAVTEFMMYWNNLKTIQGGAEKVAEIMDAAEEDRSGEPCGILSGDIRVENASFGYTEETKVLNELSCCFPDGAVTALLGPSGSGKTTLTHLLTRMYSVPEGRITLDGKDIRDYALDDYWRNFVVVSQNSLLFSGSLRENLCYGNPEASDALIEGLNMEGITTLAQYREHAAQYHKAQFREYYLEYLASVYTEQWFDASQWRLDPDELEAFRQAARDQHQRECEAHDTTFLESYPGQLEEMLRDDALRYLQAILADCLLSGEDPESVIPDLEHGYARKAVTDRVWAHMAKHLDPHFTLDWEES